MELRAFLNDDGTAAFSVGEPGNMTSAEIEWHSAEMTFKGSDGAVVRSVAVTMGGKPEVTGPGEAPEPAQGATGDGHAGAG